MTMKLGCGKADITPDYPVYQRGYGARNCLSNGIEDRLEIGAMLFCDGVNETLLITVDTLGLTKAICDDLMAELGKEFGYQPNQIFISSSHTHFAPGYEDYQVTFPGGDLELGQFPAEDGNYACLLEKLKDAVRQARSNVEVVTTEEAEIQLPELSFNRRTIIKATGLVETNYTWPANDSEFEFQPADPAMMVWRFKSATGNKAILARYSAHPVTGGGDSYLISADYPGAFKRHVKELFGCEGFFILGTNGDSVPMNRQGTSRDDIGCIMARAIRLAGLQFRTAPDFSVALKVIPMNFKLAVKTDRATADETFNKMLAEAKKKPECDDDFRFFGYKYSFVKMYPSDDVPLNLTIMKMGTRILAGMPFEALTEVGTLLRKACPNAIIISQINGAEAYLPLAKEYPRGGYEVTWGPRFHKTAGDEVLGTLIKEISQLA